MNLSTMHELIQAYIAGKRWVACTDSTFVMAKTEAAAKRELKSSSTTTDRIWDETTDSCWQLDREIAFRLTGKTPWSIHDRIQDGALDGCEVADLIILPTILKRARQYDGRD